MMNWTDGVQRLVSQYKREAVGDLCVARFTPLNEQIGTSYRYTQQGLIRFMSIVVTKVSRFIAS